MVDPVFVKNPWSAEFWNLTRQGMYVQKYGLGMAEKKAALVGASIGDLKPKSAAPAIERHWIIQKKGGGGGGGQGFSGDGPPQ